MRKANVAGAVVAVLGSLSAVSGYGCGAAGNYTCGSNESPLVVAAGQVVRLQDCHYVDCPTIRVQPLGQLILERVSFTASRSTNSSAGSVFLDRGFLNATGVRFQNSVSQTGAAFAARSSQIFLQDVEMIALMSVYGGGAFQAFNTTVVARNLLCRHSLTVDGYGGCGLVRGKGRFECHNCSFVGNRASGNGAFAGALMIEGIDSRGVVRNSYFAENEAAYDAAISSLEEAQLQVFNSVFVRHRVGDCVMGSTYQANLEVFDSVFSNNSIQYGLVAVWLEAWAFINNCTFHENSALYAAGVYVVYDSWVRVENSIFTNNVARDVAGVIFLDVDSAMELRNCSMHGNRAGKETSVLYGDRDSSLSIGGFLRITNNTVNDDLCHGAFFCIYGRITFENVFRRNQGSIFSGAFKASNIEDAKAMAQNFPAGEFPDLQLVNGIPVRSQYVLPSTNSTLTSEYAHFVLPTLQVATFDMFGYAAMANQGTVRLFLSDVTFSPTPVLLGTVERTISAKGMVNFTDVGFRASGNGSAVLLAILTSTATELAAPPRITIIVNAIYPATTRTTVSFIRSHPNYLL